VTDQPNDPPASIDLDAFVAALLAGDRATLARAITLVESTADHHRALARALLRRVLPHTGAASRIGVTGTPGVGKSTLIEAWGLALASAGHRLAVLAVDPSSTVTGGSILGDKTRMIELARREDVFVRPSPSAGNSGGVGHATRETILLCEAAGYDVVFVETVGVGQAEVEVSSLVDLFVLLLQPASGDELQGIKRGILELADVVVVNKADGALEPAAKRMRQEFELALRLLRAERGAPPPVLAVSAATGAGVEELSDQVLHLLASARSAGTLEARRKAQLEEGLWFAIDATLARMVRQDPRVRAIFPEIMESVHIELMVAEAVERVIDAFRAP